MTKAQAQKIADRLTENEARVVRLIYEFEFGAWVSQGDLHTGPTVLHPLMGAGIIRSAVSDRNRIIYRLTPLGLSVAQALTGNAND